MRNRQLTLDILNGKSLSSVSTKYDISKTRVIQIVRKELRVALLKVCHTDRLLYSECLPIVKPYEFSFKSITDNSELLKELFKDE